MRQQSLALCGARIIGYDRRYLRIYPGPVWDTPSDLHVAWHRYNAEDSKRRIIILGFQ